MMSAARFRIYAIENTPGGEVVRWTDTKLKKDHHENVSTVLHYCDNGIRGLSHRDGAAFMEARSEFMKKRLLETIGP